MSRILFITETWINEDEWSPCDELCPTDYNLIHTPRSLGHGGGACKQQFKWHCLSTVNYSSFEVQLLKLEFFREWSFIDLQSTQPGFYPGIFRFFILYCIIV